VPVQSYLPAEILDYVETHAPSEDSGLGISQRELAKALGYHPCSMSRPLSELVDRGYLRTHRGVVRGGVRKQYVYALTEQGRGHLREQTKDVPMFSGDVPPPPNPFLGRRPELSELLALSKTGGMVIFLDGPAGMGKTALAARHVRRLRVGRIPFWFTIRNGSSGRHLTIALARALSSLGAQQLAYYSQLPRQPQGREVADLAARALADRPLLMVVDDVQVASPDMRKFLEDFLHGIAKGREDLFLFLSQQPPFCEVEELARNRLTLAGLDRSAAHDLTDRLGGLAERFETVYQATLGSPLLLQLALAAPGVEATAASLPAAIVDGLPPAELLSLLPVALANEPIPESFVLQAGNIAEGRIDDLVTAGVLQRTPERRVEITHVLRAALIGKVGPIEERASHLKLAGFYARSHRPEAVRERFLHLVAAEAWKPAGEILNRQERTLLGLGYSDLLRSALRHLTLAIPKGASRVRALRTEATLLRLHSEYSEAILSLRRAIVEAQNDLRTQAECYCQIVELYSRLRQVEDADRALAEARRRGPFHRRLQVYLLLSEARIVEMRGEFEGAQAQFQAVFELAQRYHVSDLALEAVAAWSRLASLAGRGEEALGIVSRALPEARASGRLEIVFSLMLVRARVLAENGDSAAAESEMRSLRTEAEGLGYLNPLTYTLSGLAATATATGRWAEASAYARQAITLAERLGNDTVLGHTLGLMCTAEMQQGRLEEARLHGERALTILGRLPPSDSLAFTQGYLSETYLALGMVPEARTLYHQTIELCQRLGLNWLKSQMEKEVGIRLGEPGSGGIAKQS
jgi:tetratricopeptide (TPR) repeat protein/DNA-binding MarR family transcriptional regulator